MIRAQGMIDGYDDLREEIQKILLMFDINDFTDKNHDGIPDDEQENNEPIDTEPGLVIEY